MPSLVQSASNTATSATSVTVTLGSNTTAGNCLVVCAGSLAGSLPSVSTVTLGGSAGNFAKAKGQTVASFTDGDCETWTDQNCAGGQTSVVVTFSASQTDILVWVMEWSGIAASGAVDKTNSTSATTSSFSSGSSTTLTNANEVIIGASLAASVTGTVSEAGPSSPWTNLAQIQAGSGVLIAGWQIVTATTAQTYSGTISGGNGVFMSAAVIITLTEAAGSPAGTVQPRATVPVPRRKPARALWQRITGTAFVKVPAPVQQPAPAPRRKPARAYIRFTPVTTTNAVPATPVNGTVQPRATVTARSRRPARALVLFTPPAPPGKPSGTVQSRATLVTARRRPARAVIPARAAPLVPAVPAVTEGGPVYYPYHHRGRGRTR